VLSRIAWRITLYRGTRLLCRGVLAASAPAFVLLLAARFHPLPHAPHAAGLLLICGALWGVLEGLRRRSNLLEAAILTDRRMALGELLPAALESPLATPVSRLLMKQAEEKTGSLRPSRVSAFPFPWEIMALLLVCAATLALVALASPKVPPTSPDVVRAARIGAETREIRSTAAEIDARFPKAGTRVSEALQKIARKLTDTSEDFTETVKAVGTLAAGSEKEADRLLRTEEALLQALQDPESPAVENGALQDALRQLGSDPHLSPDAASAAREAMGALEGGDVPRFIENTKRLREDLERIRQARMALEAASLRLKASWEKMQWAFEEETPDGDGTAKTAAGTPPPSARRPGVHQAFHAQRWDPAFDALVKRYFSAIGGK
jgi:hypothetical protein